MDTMLDLETLSTRPDAAILQVAAVAFDPDPYRPTIVSGDQFNMYARIDSDGQGRVENDTLRFWLLADDPARRALAAGLDGADGLVSVLVAFAAWRQRYPGPIWSHGASFDIPILDAAYARVGLQVPWGYRDTRDTRTLYALATPDGRPPEVPAFDVRGVEHDALYDARLQARQVREAYRLLRER